LDWKVAATRHCYATPAITFSVDHFKVLAKLGLQHSTSVASIISEKGKGTEKQLEE